MTSQLFWIRAYESGQPWAIAERDEKQKWRVDGYLLGGEPFEIGPEILPPGHPRLKGECDLRRVLELVAAYLAPSSVCSYGKLVDLLSVVRGCEGWTYSDLYPVLFNCQAKPNPYADDPVAAPSYDCEVAARALRIELGLPPLVPATWQALLDSLSDEQRFEIMDLAGERVWRCVALAATSATDDEALAALRDLKPAIEALGPESTVALANGVASALGPERFGTLFMALSTGQISVIHRAVGGHARDN